MSVVRVTCLRGRLGAKGKLLLERKSAGMVTVRFKFIQVVPFSFLSVNLKTPALDDSDSEAAHLIPLLPVLVNNGIHLSC